MDKLYNFSSGPAALPNEVMLQAQKEFVNFNKSGLSIMEMSHRGNEFGEVIEGARELMRELMQIPNSYEVLFMHGGASTQFALVPLNFSINKKACFIDTGVWSEKAINEASKSIKVQILASSKDECYTQIPDYDINDIESETDYLHITTNNTIYGTCYTEIPQCMEVPLIADMSSDILSKPYNIHQFGMVYAGAQKNIGPSGVAVCIIRKDLLEKVSDMIPNIFSYKKFAENHSMYNTPSTFSIYMCKLVLEWLKKKGGVEAIYPINLQKAKLLYDFIDNSSLFHSYVKPEHRSIMNVPFFTGNKALDEVFIQEANKNGLMQLKGHRTLGGMRASIYNAMPYEGVKALVAFMKKFEMDHR